ncbi:DNA glycosylase AlkZ-like family protein [Escherichia coli]
MKPALCRVATFVLFATACWHLKKWAGNTKDAWMQEHEAEIAQLIQHIHDNGPVCSADFEHPRKGASGWWEWKPHKRHLEGLFTAGKVMVIERRNFQRVYDLTHRVMPDWDDERDLVSQTEAEIIMLDNSAHSLGIFREQWLADYYRLKRPALAAWREARLNSSKSLLCMLKNWAIFG